MSGSLEVDFIDDESRFKDARREDSTAEDILVVGDIIGFLQLCLFLSSHEATRGWGKERENREGGREVYK